ncbi:hypothetical protein [Saccharopolyspora shandongensis]
MTTGIARKWPRRLPPGWLHASGRSTVKQADLVLGARSSADDGATR